MVPRAPVGAANARWARSVATAELAAVWQVPRLALASPRLLARRRATGPVVVLPGRGVGDASTSALRAYLTALGYRCRGWGLGLNDGEVARLARAVVPLLEREAERAGAPVGLVGQSMGGTVAREVARARPELVSRIITLGSPLLGSRSSRPLTRPVTAIYSEVDRIVPPSWAVRSHPLVEHVEVTSTHFGMGIDPDVWRIVADRLATPVGVPPVP